MYFDQIDGTIEKRSRNKVRGLFDSIWLPAFTPEEGSNIIKRLVEDFEASEKIYEREIKTNFSTDDSEITKATIQSTDNLLECSFLGVINGNVYATVLFRSEKDSDLEEYKSFSDIIKTVGSDIPSRKCKITYWTPPHRPDYSIL